MLLNLTAGCHGDSVYEWAEQLEFADSVLSVAAEIRGPGWRLGVCVLNAASCNVYEVKEKQGVCSVTGHMRSAPPSSL